MAGKRRIASVVCPRRGHARSRVSSHGPRERGGVRYQRYRCRPLTEGAPSHTFELPIPASPDESPPRPTREHLTGGCPAHPNGRMVRNGPIGKHTETARQRYRCFPDPADRTVFHDYLPPLPRAYTVGCSCERCEVPLGLHRGDPASAKRHAFAAITVARALARLGTYETYGNVGQWLQARRRKPRTRAVVPGAAGRVKNAKKRAADNAWRLAADLTETYAPVVWEPLEAQFRAEARAERSRIDADRAAGRPLDRPLAWVVDEHTIKQGVYDIYNALVVGETAWFAGEPFPDTRLRLIRVMPARMAEDWLLVFDELAGAPAGSPDEIWPDFVVSDCAPAIISAYQERFRGRPTRWVPSLWHMGKAVREFVTGSQWDGERLGDPYGAIEDHLALLSRDSPILRSVGDWAHWWDVTERLALSLSGSERKFGPVRANWEPPWADLILLLPTAWIPHSNAAVEVHISRRVKPLFANRTAFANIERTNRLADVVVASVNGRLDDEAAVARLLREDAHRHGGWASVQRELVDPRVIGKARGSLRDPVITSRAAYLRGLR